MLRELSYPPIFFLTFSENAVQRLLEVLGPTDPRVDTNYNTLRSVCGVDAVRNGMYGSNSFANARRDANLLCGGDDAVGESSDIGSDCLAERAFVRRKDAPPLDEVICVVLSSLLFRGAEDLDDDDATTKPHAYTQVLDRFAREGFAMVQLKFCVLSARQIKEYTHRRRAHRSRRTRAEGTADPMLRAGEATLVVAFERENAIARAATIIATTVKKKKGAGASPLDFLNQVGYGARGPKSPLGDLVGDNRVYSSRSSAEAAWELAFFFTRLNKKCKSGSIEIKKKM